jgi:heme-degrading monooxygenase HmoA
VYARSTSIQAQPSSIDAGIAHVRDEIMPAVQAMDGCIGISLLADRDSGRCIVTTSWDSEDAMHASRDRVRPLRDQAAAKFESSGDTQVDEWEIAVLHRDHNSADGACVRATWIKVPPDQAARAIEFYKTDVLPALESLEGFCSASLLINRSTGRAVSSSTFDSHAAMDRNREQARELRNGRTRELGADILDIGEFELALAHLRVPEMV